jgi:CSLREA domain-containing protein
VKHFWIYIVLALALLCGAILPTAQIYAAGSIVRVDSTADAPDADPNDGRCAAADGACTLRAAIMHSNPIAAAQTVELPGGIYTLRIEGDDPANDQAVRDLDILGNLTLRGIGPGSTIIQAGPVRGAGIDRVLEVHRGAEARLENVQLRHGKAEDAGAIRNWGTLSLIHSFVSANDSASSGGGITNNGDLALIESRVTGNTAREGGGITNFGRLRALGSAINSNAAVQAGGLSAFGQTTLVNSTISSNRADDDGGGIIVGVSATSLRMLNVTLARNIADANGDLIGRGGGIRNSKLSGVTMRNTIIANNRDVGIAPDCLGTIGSENYNLLASVRGCTFAAQSGDIIEADPRLGLLGGEAPQTHSLSPGSPAIDAGDPAGCVDDFGATLATDQRGGPRPVGSRCDQGAFESSTPAPAPGPDERCFPETGYCIVGRIREYWETNGGLPVFGYPIGPQQAEQVEAGIFQAQLFERNRMELHPENARPYDVLLGRRGAEQMQQAGMTAQPEQPRAECMYFERTRLNLCGRFAEAWRSDGLRLDGQAGIAFEESLALFGFPVSNAFTVTFPDGTRRTIQYFERARFEAHPENATPYDVLFGLLGNELRDGTPPPRP